MAMAAAALVGAAGIPSAWAADGGYPNKPITLVVGSPPGGSNDVFARMIAKRLGETLKQSVIVENRPSSGGVLANAIVAKAAPDGYTLCVVSSTFTTGAAIRTNLGYDAVKDFTPVAMLARGPLLVTVNKGSQFHTIRDLVQYARVHPGKLDYGTSGTGSINHFATELFAQSADIHMTHVPYKGMAQATNDLLGGQIHLLVASAPSILSQVKSGNVRALAVTTAKRSPVAPDLPALEEGGYKGSAVDLWWGVLAPANTPAPVVATLNGAINDALKGAEMKDFLLNEGAEAAPSSPDEFRTYVVNEIDRWKGVAAKSGIKAD
jgi:tripartite-type tricarboxylate transporter receptor subunit TctC